MQTENYRRLQAQLLSTCHTTKDPTLFILLNSASKAIGELLTTIKVDKTGEWLERVEKLTWCEDDVEVYYDCSVCGTHNFAETSYCPNCGAAMKLED